MVIKTLKGCEDYSKIVKEFRNENRSKNIIR